jgi:hypothetical protein
MVQTSNILYKQTVDRKCFMNLLFFSIVDADNADNEKLSYRLMIRLLLLFVFALGDTFDVVDLELDDTCTFHSSPSLLNLLLLLFSLLPLL